jgi:hypothetical protein
MPPGLAGLIWPKNQATGLAKHPFSTLQTERSFSGVVLNPSLAMHNLVTYITTLVAQREMKRSLSTMRSVWQIVIVEAISPLDGIETPQGHLLDILGKLALGCRLKPVASMCGEVNSAHGILR